jgi:hypothetical protein
MWHPQNKPKADALTRLIYNSDTWLGAAAWERYTAVFMGCGSR